MPVITLPDGSQRSFSSPSAWTRSPPASVPACARPRSRAGRRQARRHLVQAVKELYPDAQVTIGPVIEDGFYYDFAYKRALHAGGPVKIESEDGEIVARDDLPRGRGCRATTRSRSSRTSASTTRPRSSPASPRRADGLYRQGDWVDLCRGPHLPSTGKLGSAFKLMKWPAPTGAATRATRCSSASTAPPGPTTRTSKAYLKRLEEAEKRDHRRSAARWTSSTAGRGPGLGVLAPQGLDPVPDHDRLHAREAAPPATRR
jgi:threonyl-tRNA synthetase